MAHVLPWQQFYFDDWHIKEVQSLKFIVLTFAGAIVGIEDAGAKVACERVFVFDAWKKTKQKD